MRPQNAVRFAQDWVDAWNQRDLDAVLKPWSDYAVFCSERAGTVASKDAIRSYWEEALTPGLTMRLVNVLLGPDTVVILYQNHLGRLCSEAFEFDGAGRVVRASAYAEQWPW